jgi:hypothetical protein
VDDVFQGRGWFSKILLWLTALKCGIDY